MLKLKINNHCVCVVCALALINYQNGLKLFHSFSFPLYSRRKRATSTHSHSDNPFKMSSEQQQQQHQQEQRSAARVLLPTIILVFTLVASNLSSTRVQAVGLGDLHLWTYDSNEAQLTKNANALFASDKEAAEFVAIKPQLEKVLKSMKVEVVAPGKQLLDIMNNVSTKTRFMFFENYQHYFEELKVDSTSRPMLYAYLGLQFASPEQLASWYKPSSANKRKQVTNSCKTLIEMRKSIPMQAEDVELINRSKNLIRNRFHMAYLVFQNNLTLFMLDNFLFLCLKIEPDQVKDEMKDVELSF